MVKNYAVSIKHVTPFDTKLSVLAEVYGFYDAEDPSILHQIEPSLVNLYISKNSDLASQMAPRVRLLVPALGISAEGREISTKRGTSTIYNLIGVHTAHILVLNVPELKQDVVTKSEVSRVMLGADAGMMDRIVGWAKSLF